MTLQSRPNPSSNVPSILVVESDLVVRHPLAEYLRECGYKVIEANDTDEAVAILNETGSIGVVLVDVSSPGKLGGFGLARQIRESRTGVKVILAATIEKVAGAAGDLCRSGPTLAKPYDHQLLLDQVKRELARSSRQRKAATG